MPGHSFRIAVLRRLACWQVGDGTSVERHARVTTKGGVAVGRNCIVGRGTVLDGRGGVTVGDWVNISPEVTCLTADHDPDSATFKGRFRPVEIGSNCWLATRAIVLPGAVVGDGAVVGAGAVVTGKVESWTVVAGVPARKIRDRDPGAQASLPRYRRWLH